MKNIQCLPADVRIILSDEVSSDDTAQQIAAKFVNDSRIQVRMRNGLPGWREHCNALIRENQTEFFSLLPQDDLIEPGYYEKLLGALQENPDAGLAFGTLIAVRSGFEREKLAPPPFPLGTSKPWIEAIMLERYWCIGIAFRGVIRREMLRPMSPTPGDRQADFIWVFGMALTGFLLEVPDAVYTKHYYKGSTSDGWLLIEEEYKSQLITECRNVFSDQEFCEQAIGLVEQVSHFPRHCHSQHAESNTICVRLCRYMRRFIPVWILRRLSGN